jgi:hypothetical protein
MGAARVRPRANGRLTATLPKKRGRKGKGMTPLTDHTQTSERLALASQTLVRELSRQTRPTSPSNQSFIDVPPAQPVPVSPTVTKKQSRWKLSPSLGCRKGPDTILRLLFLLLLFVLVLLIKHEIERRGKRAIGTVVIENAVHSALRNDTKNNRWPAGRATGK